MALRLGAERAALPLPDEPAGQVAALPTLANLATAMPATTLAGPGLRAVEGVASDDDDPEELFDDPEADDFYADAFEVIG